MTPNDRDHYHPYRLTFLFLTPKSQELRNREPDTSCGQALLVDESFGI